jgi:hypothetical protein
MTTAQIKEMMYFVALAEKEERAKKEQKQAAEKQIRDQKIMNAQTFKICLTYSAAHPVYGKIRETKYQFFYIEGVKNAKMIYNEYVSSGRSMNIEKVRMYIVEANGDLDKVCGTHFA